MAKTLRQTVELSRSLRLHPKRCLGPQDLSRLERECMRAIWLGSAKTVAEVQRYLSTFRPLAYTTVLTVMDRLAKKGAVTRLKRGKAHVYTPALSFERSRKEAVANLVDFYFEGSVEKLVEHLRTAAGSLGTVANSPEDAGASRPSAEMHDCLL